MKDTIIQLSIFLIILTLSITALAQNTNSSSAHPAVIENNPAQSINEIPEKTQVPIKTAHNSKENSLLSHALEQDTVGVKASQLANEKHMYISKEDALKIIKSLGIENAKEALEETEKKNKDFKSINQNIEKDKK